jgi:hypothetical protein
MNRKITVELDWDTIDKITTCSMKGLVENLEIDLENRKAGNGMAIFVNEKEYDVVLLEKHVEAFKLVLKYYGEQV